MISQETIDKVFETANIEDIVGDFLSGEFLSGTKSKELCLIDEIGDANQVLREKFGEDVIIKKFEKSKSWLSKKLSSSNDHVDQVANILEEKSIWQKYGL